MSERGLKVDHSTICRWIHAYAPEIEKRTRPYLKATGDSWKIDQTYIKVNGEWKYLDRAVDSQGNTTDFRLSANRDTKAATRFLQKVLKAKHNNQPRLINVEHNAAYPLAIKALQEKSLLEEDCELRQVKYLNNLVEQDHRGIKKITRASLGYKSFHTAVRTIKGIEIMHMINKGQVEGVGKKQRLEQKRFVESLFGIAV